MTRFARPLRYDGWIALTALLGGAGCALPTASKGFEGDGEFWQLSVDNDSYNFDDGNYTTDDRDRPLSYAIAPGAWIYDISQGFAKTHSTGGHLDASHPRKLKLVPHADRGTTFDFDTPCMSL